MSRLKLTPGAHADLEAIWEHSATRWDINQAEAYVLMLGRSLEALAETPGLGRKIDDIRLGYLKFPAGSHVIFYRRSESGIEVIRILHKSMDVERHL